MYVETRDKYDQYETNQLAIIKSFYFDNCHKLIFIAFSANKQRSV